MITPELLEKWKFLHYVNTPTSVVMREVYSGVYISYCYRKKHFRLMPDYSRDFPGIILPHTTLGAIVGLVSCLGGDWCRE